ncbi:MAG TPA: BACON domain-containing carbohydrate-binding protein [Puia sp.]|uniref:BACON domain-containing protein n=1 Tax=Puia sp. TaxID=2045100 RepID=UPI002C1DA3FB|nr:BACON domain-containing carbohydrate-binding protein [Puia sp.]HVU97655.1 BACON domain-containing carbohydrate-binding protein [Puia sp.]
MKPRATLFALFCLALGHFLSSCHKNEFKPSLTLSTTDLLLDSTVGAVDTFSITSNVSWKLTVSPAAATGWLQLSQTSGNNSAIIRVTITGSNTNVTQPITFTLEATGNANLPSQTITLGQKGSLQVSGASITLDGTPTTDTVTVNTGLVWKAATSASWIRLDTTQAAGTYRLKISADTNRTGAAQSGTVTLTPVNNTSASAVTINVTQKPFYAILNFFPLSGKAGTTITLNGYFPPIFTVTMNNSSAATIISHSAAQIVCTLPADATGGYLFVNIPGVLPPPVSTQQFTVLSDWKKLSDNSPGFSTNNQPSVVYPYGGNLYFGWGSTGDRTIYRLDTTNYQWVSAITIPASVQVVQDPVWFIINNKLYVGGGYDATARSFYEYDMTQGNSPAAWRQLTSLPESMLNGSGFAVGGTGYIQSGVFSPAGNNLLYQFSTTGSSDPGTWTALGPLNVKDGPAASVVVGNTVYIGGGNATAIDDPSIGNVIFGLNPPSTTLTAIASIPEPLSISSGQRFSTWTKGNTAYFYDDNIRTLFSYDPASNSWTKISTVPNSITTPMLDYATFFNGHTLVWNNTGAIFEYVP